MSDLDEIRKMNPGLDIPSGAELAAKLKHIKIYCTNCARQIVSYNCSDKHIVGGGPVTRSVGNSVICHECARDLDSNGLYPEERK